MDAKKLYKRVCATLEADVRRLWGRIREAEEKSCGVGTISRFYNGTRDIALEPLLDFLCAVGIDPASFFARALGRPLDAEVLLNELIVRHRSGGRVWREVENATLQLERGDDRGTKNSSRATPEVIADLLGGMKRASRREQMRRLRASERYHDCDFARAYLRHLDSLRDDEPDLAARLVARVAIHLIPAIPGTLKSRIELQCDALGIFGSAVRLKADFSTAAQAFLLALQLTHRHDLPDAKGRLLHRVAHLLEQAKNPEIALIPLREAIEIYVHCDSAVGLGKTLIVQGRIYCCIKRYEKAIEVLTASLRHLPEENPEFARYHFSVYQSLAAAHQQLGDLQEARMLLAKASTFVTEEERVRRANLTWQQGDLSLAEGDAGGAEALMQASWQDLAGHVNVIQEALLSVDLIRSLLEQGKFLEACSTASSATCFLEPFAGNPTAEAAVLHLARAGIEGRLNIQVVQEARHRLKEARP